MNFSSWNEASLKSFGYGGLISPNYFDLVYYECVFLFCFVQSVTIKTSLYLVFSLVNGKIQGQLDTTFQNNYSPIKHQWKKTSQLKLLPQIIIDKINTNKKDQPTQTPLSKQTVTFQRNVLLKFGITTI